jgi:hypothetical protein
MTLSEKQCALAATIAKQVYDSREDLSPGAYVRDTGTNIAVVKTMLGLTLVEKLVQDHGFSFGDALEASKTYLHPLFPDESSTSSLSIDGV